MFRLLNLLLNANTIIFLIIFIYVIILFHNKKKIKEKIWRSLCFVPLIIILYHYYKYYVPNGFQLSRFIPLYLYPILIVIWQFLYKKEKIFKVFYKVLIILGVIFYFLTFYAMIFTENIHVLTRYSYTESFTKTISILKKEYVLNEHKKINYDYLYNKYYSTVEKAEKDNDEQLYFKTMYEFTSNIKDCHVSFSFFNDDIEDITKNVAFLDDYQNKDYGFASILLSNNDIVAILVDENSEAYSQGLRDGSIILKKDGKNVHDELENVIVPKLSGYPVLEDENLFKSFYLFATGNDSISLTFIDEDFNEKTININAVSNYNEKPSILEDKFLYYDYNSENYDTKMLDEDTGYIKISDEMYDSFKGAIGYIIDDSTFYMNKMLENKIDSLINQGMNNLVIDLRSNTGGYLTESEAVASLFTNNKYLVSKDIKYNGLFYDKSYLKGNGKYSNMKLTILVNSDTASAGDCLAYLLSKNENATLVGFTNSNNSSQSVGGIIFLSGGNAYITYPIYKSVDKNNNIFIDPSDEGKATVKVDDRIVLDVHSVKEIVYSDDNYDWLLEYIKNNY